MGWTWGTEKNGVTNDSQLSRSKMWVPREGTLGDSLLQGTDHAFDLEVGGYRALAQGRGLGGKSQEGRVQGPASGAALPGSPGAGRASEGPARLQEAGLRVYFQVFRRRLRNVRSVPSETEENGGGGSGPALWRVLPFPISALSPGPDKARPEEATTAFPPPPSILPPTLWNSGSLTTLPPAPAPTLCLPGLRGSASRPESGEPRSGAVTPPSPGLSPASP